MLVGLIEINEPNVMDYDRVEASVAIKRWNDYIKEAYSKFKNSKRKHYIYGAKIYNYDGTLFEVRIFKNNLEVDDDDFNEIVTGDLFNGMSFYIGAFHKRDTEHNNALYKKVCNN